MSPTACQLRYHAPLSVQPPGYRSNGSDVGFTEKRTDGVDLFAATRKPLSFPNGRAVAKATPAIPIVIVVCGAAGRSCGVKSTIALSALPYGEPKPPVVNVVSFVMNASTAPRKPPVGVSSRYG